MRRNQRGEVAAITAQQHRRPAIIGLREAQPAAGRRNLDAERAHRPEMLDNVRRDFTGAIDFIRVHFLAQKFFQPLEKSVSLVVVLRLLNRKRMDRAQIEPAHEQAAGETLPPGGVVARRLGQLQGRPLTGRHLRGVYDGSRLVGGVICSRFLRNGVRCAHHRSPFSA